MTIKKLSEHLYELSPSEGLFLKSKETNDVYEGSIYLPNAELQSNYEEVDENTKQQILEEKSKEIDD